MRTFIIDIPTKPGPTDIDGLPVDLTDDDAEDLNGGHSITTLAVGGEEIALFPHPLVS